MKSKRHHRYSETRQRFECVIKPPTLLITTKTQTSGQMQADGQKASCMLRGRQVNKGFGREFSKKRYIFGQNTDVLVRTDVSGNQRVRADAKDCG